MKRPIIFSFVVFAAVGMVAAAPASPSGDQYRHSVVGTDGGEPSIAAAHDGTLYISYPGGKGMTFYRSKDAGATWKAGTIADPSSGDTTVNVDASGAVYQANLNGTFQGDVYKSLDGGAHWTKGVTATSSPLAAVYGPSATDSPFLMDREWTDAYIPPGKTTDEARVYIGYHDFGPSIIWVNASKDGGKTFSSQKSVISDPVAQANSFCNTIPGGLKIVQSGPHAGRVYVAWMAGSVETNVPSGCNITQLDTFGQIWMAWSDDEGATWTDKLVYDAGFGHDASAIFADLALDRAGNPYVAWTMNSGSLPHTGAAGDQWNIYVSASFDGGKTWNAATGGAPYTVTTDTGTHFFPAIAAGDPGRVVLAYIATRSVIPQLPYGKPFPGEDANARWDVYLSRTLNLTSSKPSWVQEKLTAKSIHTGDVCTLGIFCTPGQLIGVQNRDLLDFIDVVAGPSGLVHVAYTDTESKPGTTIIETSDQVAGISLFAAKSTHAQPKVARVLAVQKLPATGVGAPIVVAVLMLLGALLIGRSLRRV
ncbi:MAG: sialidase family protein [Actinomycetota bacterium]